MNGLYRGCSAAECGVELFVGRFRFHHSSKRLALVEIAGVWAVQIINNDFLHSARNTSTKTVILEFVTIHDIVNTS